MVVYFCVFGTFIIYAFFSLFSHLLASHIRILVLYNKILSELTIGLALYYESLMFYMQLELTVLKVEKS